MIMGFCRLLNQGPGNCMTYTAKHEPINAHKIPKGAAAKHCNPSPVIRDKRAQHGIYSDTHTALPCQVVLSGILQNVGQAI